MESLEKELELSWSEGFFFLLRSGIFDDSRYERLKIKFIEIPDGEPVSIRLVQLLWFTPLFIYWQKERLVENGVAGEKVDEVSNFFFNQCERIIGLP